MNPVNDRLPMLCRLPSILQLDRRADYKNNENVQRKENELRMLPVNCTQTRPRFSYSLNNRLRSLALCNDRNAKPTLRTL